MKRTLFSLAVLGLMFFANSSIAQEAKTAKADPGVDVVQAPVDSGKVDETAATPETVAAPAEEPVVKRSGTQQIKKTFIDGGGFMFPILFCLIFGLAICIEKVITLNMKSVNSKKLLVKVEEKLKMKDAEGAQEICRNTRGSIASIFYQAISRRKEGIEGVEKAIVSYGSVEMGLLEKGLIWISLFIALAPMLGFMGTVVGMISAFDNIEMAGTISPSLVAGGIKVALITTVGGLIVAVILQLFYNYLISKIDGIVNEMEDSSITLVDIMIENGISEKTN